MSECIPFDEYAAIDAVNWSTLSAMRDSPLHYQHRIAQPRRDTDALRAGRAAHTAVLEPDRFALDCAVYQESKSKGEGARLRWAAFQAANAGRTILDAEEYANCCAIRDAVRSHRVAQRYIATGRAEVSLVWTDPETKLRCKGRIDWLCDAIVDLKTARTIDGRQFFAAAARYGYHVQLAHYAAGYQAITGNCPPVKMIAVESAEPYDVAVFDLGAETLDAGAEEAKDLLHRVATSRRTGEWHGRYPDEEPFRLPAWATDGGEFEVTETEV